MFSRSIFLFSNFLSRSAPQAHPTSSLQPKTQSFTEIRNALLQLLSASVVRKEDSPFRGARCQALLSECERPEIRNQILTHPLLQSEARKAFVRSLALGDLECAATIEKHLLDPMERSHAIYEGLQRALCNPGTKSPRQGLVREDLLRVIEIQERFPFTDDVAALVEVRSAARAVITRYFELGWAKHAFEVADRFKILDSDQIPVEFLRAAKRGLVACLGRGDFENGQLIITRLKLRDSPMSDFPAKTERYVAEHQIQSLDDLVCVARDKPQEFKRLGV
jgi:hypothetical protein